MVMQGQDTSNVRCCPVCKQTSHFVVPHFRHVTDPVRTPALPSPFFTPQVPPASSIMQRPFLWLCPDFLCPLCASVLQVRKDNLVRNYKESMAKKPCKYFEYG